MLNEPTPDEEIGAMVVAYRAIASQPFAARDRMLSWLESRLRSDEADHGRRQMRDLERRVSARTEAGEPSR